MYLSETHIELIEFYSVSVSYIGGMVWLWVQTSIFPVLGCVFFWMLCFPPTV